MMDYHYAFMKVLRLLKLTYGATTVGLENLSAFEFLGLDLYCRGVFAFTS